MAASLAVHLYTVLVEPLTKPYAPPLEPCTPLPVISRCHAEKLRENRGSANVFEKVLRESVRSATSGGGKISAETEGRLADSGCGSLESVELVFAAAHKPLLSFASGNVKERSGTISTKKEYESFFVVLMPTDNAISTHA